MRKILMWLLLPGIAVIASTAQATLAAASQVPEPSMLGLFAVGTIAGILAFYFGKRK